MKSHLRPLLKKNTSPCASASLSGTKAGFSTVIWFLLQVMDALKKKKKTSAVILAACCGTVQSPPFLRAPGSLLGLSPPHPTHSNHSRFAEWRSKTDVPAPAYRP